MMNEMILIAIVILFFLALSCAFPKRKPHGAPQQPEQPRHDDPRYGATVLVGCSIRRTKSEENRLVVIDGDTLPFEFSYLSLYSLDKLQLTQDMPHCDEMKGFVKARWLGVCPLRYRNEVELPNGVIFKNAPTPNPMLCSSGPGVRWTSKARFQ